MRRDMAPKVQLCASGRAWLRQATCCQFWLYACVLSTRSVEDVSPWKHGVKDGSRRVSRQLYADAIAFMTSPFSGDLAVLPL